MTYLSDLRAVASDRPIRLVLLASLVNTFGTGLYAATYVTYGLRSDVSGAALSGALSVGALIAVFGAPAGAWAAEKYGSRNLSIAINVLRGLANVLLVVVGPWWFVGVVLALSVVDRFAFPASQTVLASVAARGDKALVLSVRQLTQTGGLALGAVTAAGAQLLLPRDLLGVLIIANAATFVVNAWLFARLPAETGPPRAQPLPWHAGWPPRRFLVALVLSALVDCAGMAVELALPLYAFEHHPSLTRWVGTAIALQAVTAVVVTAVLGRRLDLSRVARVVAGGSLVSAGGCAILGLASATDTAVVPAALAFAVLLGTGTTVVAFAVYVAVIEIAPDDGRERYLAAYGTSGSLRRIVAPGVLVAVVAISGGWFALGALVVVAGVATGVLVAGMLAVGRDPLAAD